MASGAAVGGAAARGAAASGAAAVGAAAGGALAVGGGERAKLAWVNNHRVYGGRDLKVAGAWIIGGCKC